MAEILLLTTDPAGSAEVLPALGLLAHRVREASTEPSAVLDAPDAQLVILDARRDLAGARATSRLLRATGLPVPVLLVLTAGGLPAVSAEWQADDVVLDTATPGEVDTRIRLAIERARGAHPPVGDEIAVGDLVIDAGGYTARLRGRPLDLTYREFELLKHLAGHPGRVFSRAQLLHDVWGYDYYGGTRTVDVHVRRLRAKLGLEHEQLISTVRNVGYRFDPVPDRARTPRARSTPDGLTARTDDLAARTDDPAQEQDRASHR